jgi:hypothetical protein
VKPITWLRKFVNRGDRGYPVATLAFYGPDDKKASKAVLGIIPSKDSEIQLHKWFRESPDADLRYDIKLQNTWIDIIRREGVRSVALLEEINGCPHEEGVDYPLGQVCPTCPFWAHRRRSVNPPATLLTAVASYEPNQWGALLAAAADREKLEDTWEEWNAGVEKLIRETGEKRHPLGTRPFGCRRDQPILPRRRYSQRWRSSCESGGEQSPAKCAMTLALLGVYLAQRTSSN